jgi:hypothetical protein
MVAPAPTAAPKAAPSHAWRRWLRLAASAAALAILFFLLDHIGWDVVRKAFTSVGLWGAAVLFAMGVLENLLDAAALTASLPPTRRLGLLRTLSYTSVSALVNMFIPWEAGEVVKAGLLRRHVDAQDAISGTVIWNYVFKLSRPIVTTVAALIGVLGVHGLAPKVGWALLAASAASFVPYLILKLFLRWSAMRRIAELLRRLRIWRREPEEARRSAEALDRQVRDFYRERPRDYARVLLLQMGARLTSWATYGVAAVLLGLHYGFADVALVYASLSLVGLAVLVVPSLRIGVGEGAAFLAFGLIGLDPGAGLLLTLIMRIKAIATSGAAGLLSGRR